MRQVELARPLPRQSGRIPEARRGIVNDGDIPSSPEGRRPRADVDRKDVDPEGPRIRGHRPGQNQDYKYIYSRFHPVPFFPILLPITDNRLVTA